MPTAQHPSLQFLVQGTSLHVGFRPPRLDLPPVSQLRLPRPTDLDPVLPTPVQSPHLAFHIDNPQVPPIILPNMAFMDANDDTEADPPCDPPLFDHTQPYTPPPLKIFSKSASEAFFRSLPSSTQLRLDESFGKDNINHSFSTDCVFRHVLIFLLKSGFLSPTCLNILQDASIHVYTMSFFCVATVGWIFPRCEDTSNRGIRERI
jgi:hypothetical protein